MALYNKKSNITAKMRSKMLQTRRLNVLKRYAIIQRITNEHYEPENQKKCKIQAWRHYVNELYPMSERVFYQIMRTDVEKEIQDINKQKQIDFNS